MARLIAINHFFVVRLKLCTIDCVFVFLLLNF